MPVFEQGYRRFDGELSRKSRVVPMVLENVRTRVRWWTWILLLLAWAMPYAIYAVLLFIFTAGRAMMGEAPISGMGKTPPAIVYEQTSRLRMQEIIGMLTNGSSYLFWDAMQWSTLWALMIPAIACAGILASDRRTGALQIYFARPITRRDYLLAKFLTTAAFTMLVTAVPTWGLWIEACLFSPDGGYIIDTWYVPFSILAAGLIYAIWNASIVMALSSILKRPVLVGILSLVTWLSLFAVGEVMARATKDQVWKILQPKILLGGITAPLFGLQLPEWLQSPWMLVMGGGVPIVLLTIVWFRTRAIEVHT